MTAVDWAPKKSQKSLPNTFWSLSHCTNFTEWLLLPVAITVPSVFHATQYIEPAWCIKVLCHPSWYTIYTLPVTTTIWIPQINAALWFVAVYFAVLCWAKLWQWWHISVNMRRLVGLRFIEVCVDSSLFMYVACVNVGFGCVLRYTHNRRFLRGWTLTQHRLL